MKRIAKILASVSVALVSATAFAAPSQCPQHFAGGQAPDLLNPKLRQGFIELCAEHGGFVDGYSPIVKTPLYAAEVITPEHVAEQKGLPRVNDFHPDPRLQHDQRAELDDFKRSGYDRGHMVPNADAWSAEVQDDTFALSNMIPQAPKNNRGLHAHIESAVRSYAKRNGPTYVITGPVWSGGSIQFLNGRVAIPPQIYKLVYDPRKNAAAAYLETNTDGPEGQQYTVISLQQLNQMVGMNMLPGVSNPGMLDLPKPRGKGVIGE
jgi:endonuclease G, mitochondrial